MDGATRESTARELYDAYESLQPLDKLSERFPDMTLEDAYEIQLLQIRERLAAGRTVIGHKVGLTSAAMQRQIGVEPARLRPPRSTT